MLPNISVAVHDLPRAPFYAVSLRRLMSFSFYLLAYLALLTAARTLKFVTTDVAIFDPIFREKYAANLPVILVHGISAITALAIGPAQFAAAIRRRFTVVHRALGRIYFVSILFGAISGFYMGSMAYGGIVPQTAFCLMAFLWFVTGWKGYATIREGRIAEHRDWMIRNYALTFGAVTLRVYLGILQMMGFEFDAIYAGTAWAAWLPNLALAEAMIRSRRPNSRQIVVNTLSTHIASVEPPR